jgi:hypothetical protein
MRIISWLLNIFLILMGLFDFYYYFILDKSLILCFKCENCLCGYSGLQVWFYDAYRYGIPIIFLVLIFLIIIYKIIIFFIEKNKK